MTTLADLFPEGRPREEVFHASTEQTERRLAALVGGPREDLELTRPRASATRLVRTVNAAAATSTSMPMVSSDGKVIRKRRKRVDWLTLAAASVAVVAVVTATTMGVVQSATASPAASSLKVLAADEATLLNSHQAVASTRQRISEDVATALESSAALRAALEATRSAPDPARAADDNDQENQELMPIADAAALDTTLAAVDSYRTGLQAVALPEIPAVYTRADFDEDSLSAVGAAINAVQEELAAVDAAAGEVRAARAEVDALAATLATQLTTFAATFPGVSVAALDANDEAEEQFRQTVTNAGAAVAAADLTTPAGLATLSAYRQSVIDLVADNVRAVREREEAEAEAEAEARRNNSGSGRPNDGGESNPTDPTTPPTEPTTPPTEPTDPPVDPPVDPPTDPEPPLDGSEG